MPRAGMAFTAAATALWSGETKSLRLCFCISSPAWVNVDVARSCHPARPAQLVLVLRSHADDPVASVERLLQPVDADFLAVLAERHGEATTDPALAAGN